MKNQYSDFSTYRTSPEFAPLRKAVIKRKIPKIAGFILFEAAFLVFGYFWGLNSTLGSIPPTTVLCGILGLSGLKFFGIFKMLTDRYYEGKIIRIDEAILNESKTAAGQMMNFDKKRATFDIYVELPGDEVKLVKMDCEAKVPHDYYKTGDVVRHYRGLALFEKRDKSGDEKIICNFCENYLSITEEICPFCHNRIIK